MLIAVALVFAAGIFLFFRGLATAPGEDLLETRLAQFRDQTITLEEIELQQPFSERFVRPTLERLGAFLNARVGRERIIAIQNRLALAGRPGNLTVNAFISLKLALGVMAGVLSFLLFSFAKMAFPYIPGVAGTIVLAVVVGVLGYFFPDL